MEPLFHLVVLCVLGAILVKLLKDEKQVLALLLSLAVLFAAVPAVFDVLRQLFDFFDGLMSLSGLPQRVFEPLLKVVCIAAVTKIGTGFCTEAEANTAAALLEMGGACCALFAALPLMSRVLDLFQKML